MTHVPHDTHIELHLQNMSCGHCVRAVHTTIESHPGTSAVEVQKGVARFYVQDPKSLPALLDALEEEGYPASPADGAQN